MSNYVKLTDFQTKDGLLSGDPLKKIKGTEIDDEFDSLATHIATKLDSVNAALTGVPTAPTAAVSTSTTQLATTAFVAAALALVYPVGSIFTSTSASNPASSLGFGTWVAFGAGRVLVGNGGAFSAGATGGSVDASVIAHTHTYSATTDSQGAHNHLLGNMGEQGFNNYYGDAGDMGTGWRIRNTQGTGVNAYSNTASAHTHTVSGTTASTGSSGTNANMPPYLVVYLWNRTA